MRGVCAFAIGVVIGAVLWFIFVRPWQRKQYEKKYGKL